MMRRKRNVFREWITGIDESYPFPPDDKEPVFKTAAKVHKDPPDGVFFSRHNYVDDNYPMERIEPSQPNNSKVGDKLVSLIFALIYLVVIIGLFACAFWWGL